MRHVDDRDVRSVAASGDREVHVRVAARPACMAVWRSVRAATATPRRPDPGAPSACPPSPPPPRCPELANRCSTARRPPTRPWSRPTRPTRTPPASLFAPPRGRSRMSARAAPAPAPGRSRAGCTRVVQPRPPGSSWFRAVSNWRSAPVSRRRFFRFAGEPNGEPTPTDAGLGRAIPGHVRAAQRLTGPRSATSGDGRIVTGGQGVAGSNPAVPTGVRRNLAKCSGSQF